MSNGGFVQDFNARVRWPKEKQSCLIATRVEESPEHSVSEVYVSLFILLQSKMLPGYGMPHLALSAKFFH